MSYRSKPMWRLFKDVKPLRFLIKVWSPEGVNLSHLSRFVKDLAFSKKVLPNEFQVNSFQRRKYFQGFSNSIQTVIRDFIAPLKGQEWHFSIFIYLVMSISILFKHLRVFRLSEIAWSPPVVKGLLLFIYMWNIWRRYWKGRNIFCSDDSIIRTSEERRRKISFRAPYLQ